MFRHCLTRLLNFCHCLLQALTPGIFGIVALINKAPHVTLDCSYSPVTDIFFSRWSLEIVIPVRFPRSEGTIYFLLFLTRCSHLSLQWLTFSSKQNPNYYPAPTNTLHVAVMHVFANMETSSHFWLFFFFLVPSRGCVHFLFGLHIKPSFVQCLGKSVLLATSALKKPARARTKTVDTVVWERWNLTSFAQ